jgi:sodium-dependent dicarboxylate transporter 2/3/5
MPAVAWKVAAVGLWMATWWATEAIPVPATGFIPLVTFGLLGITSTREAASSYAHPIVYLFLGAFVLAIAVEKWGLHRRLALAILRRTGTDGHRLIFGFMVVGALLSMWMTNTSTTMMMLPIAASIAGLLGEQMTDLSHRDRHNFQVALMLCLAYATTMGGLSTLIGTPPNVLLVGFLAETYDFEISFAKWMLIGVPLSVILIPVGWWVITHRLYRFDIPANPATHDLIEQMHDELGPVKTAEKRVGIIFASVVLLWMTRSWLASIEPLSGISDTGIVMTAALLFFVVPSGDAKGSPLMTWQDVSRLPWGVLILFGGGLSLAAQVSQSGLAEWVGQSLAPLASFGPLLLIAATTAVVVFLTELTSNLATAATFLPVIAAIATAAGIDPLLLCIPVTLAASCAFMLPVATPPNAIVYASGLLRIPDMVRAGFAINVIALLLITLVSVTLVPLVFGA